MRKLLLVVLVAGCWTSSKKEETKPVAKQQTPEEARAEAIVQARNAGILGSTALTQGGSFSSLTDDGPSSGFDDTNIYGGLLDDDTSGVSSGSGGTGAVYGGLGASGVGGGGSGIGSMGTGRYGQIGQGSGTGTGYGRIGGGAGYGPIIRFNAVNVTGDLDKAIIRRYLRRQGPAFKYCYEKTLLAQPGLGGTVVSKFAIGSDGKVTSSSAVGVHADVSACIAKRVETIHFPKPKSGTVQVTTSLSFKPNP